MNQSRTGGLTLGLRAILRENGGTWSVTEKMNQSRIGGLSLGLRAILRENGGAWSVTKYLTLSQMVQPRAEAPGQLLVFSTNFALSGFFKRASEVEQGHLFMIRV